MNKKDFMSSLKLGIVADEIDRDFRTAAENIKKLGLSRCEIRFLKSGRAPLCDENELREVTKIANGENIEITGFSPGLFKYTTDEAMFRQAMNETFPRAMEWAQTWGLHSLAVFGFAKPNANDENGDLFSSDYPPARIFD
jgi:sugar phosphate isomerase/epimerase